MPQESAAGQTILVVFAPGEDRTALEGIFEPPNWRVRFAQTLEEARVALRLRTVRVVISESQLPAGYTWRDLLAELQNVPDSPRLVVVDHLADDRLWAEVLNLGGYDLLTKPLDAREVLRTVSLACRCAAPDQAQPGSPKSQSAAL